MNQTVDRFIKKHSLLHKGAVVVVAVSGGPDSLALLHYLKKLSSRWELTIICAHVDHMLRGEESHREFEFVQQYCDKEQIVFEGTRIDVSAYQKEHKLSVQVAARECRYTYFNEIVNKYGAEYLALAHHGDDQIETMLMRQVRGAYGESLAGIPIKRNLSTNCFIIRPFLCVSKQEIIDYCMEYDLSFRTDESNFSNKYTRNRIRNHILPLLKQENPILHTKFQQLSELITEDQQFLHDLSKKKLEDIVLDRKEKEITISIKQLLHTPIPLQRRCFQLILNYLYREFTPEISTIHIDDFLMLVNNNHPSGQLHFPNGLLIKKQYDKCIMSLTDEENYQQFEQTLLIPGIVTFKKGKIVGEVFERNPEVQLNESNVLLDLEKLVHPLLVRNRLTGDRISLFPASGRKKLKNLFIDKKIPRDERDEWPIVVNGNGEIIWVPKIKKSNFANPTKDTTKYLLLTYFEANH